MNVFPIQVPPLREPTGDIPLLVEYLIGRYGKKAGKRFTRLATTTLELFQKYRGPANIRELQSVIERAVVLFDSEIFEQETWLKYGTSPVSTRAVPLPASISDREKELIDSALAQSRGRISGKFGAAAKLGIPRPTLDSKIMNLGIDKNPFRTA